MTRVLFVDDEAFVLRALDRAVRMRRPSWSAAFLPSAEAALEKLAAEPYDIIVSDLSMPGIDGVTLLRIVRERFPHMTRMALSGQSALGEGLRAAAAVHQWIAKPCDMRSLCEHIDQVAWARELVADPAILSRTSELSSLPSPPRLYVQVSDALARDARMADIVRLIETDPAVVSKLLQLTNSAFFSDRERVTSVARAVAILGTDLLRGLLLTADLFREGNVPAGFREHSLLVAEVARGRVGQLGQAGHGGAAAAGLDAEAFVAGLLHDVGELIVPDHTHDLLHARTGALLLGLWGLPASLTSAIAFHHDQGSAPHADEPVGRALAQAEALVEELAAGGVGADPAASERVTAVVPADQLDAARGLAGELWRASHH